MAARMALLLGALLPVCIAAVKTSASTMALQSDASAELKERPVMKVVRMLEDMKAELNKELEDDKAVYEQLTCWCKSNDQDKVKAIEMGNAQISQLESSLSEAAAKVVELKEKRASTMDEIDADQKALNNAQELRFKENKAFHAEEVDLIEAVKACKQAVVVLSKHNAALPEVRSVARLLSAARVQELVLSGSGAELSRVRANALKEFIDGASTASSFLAVPGFQSYAPQSGQIFGILKQMQEQFESSLSEAQKTELKAQEEFEQLRAAKKEELAAGKAKVVEIDADLAALGEKAAEETKELEDTKAQLGLDTEFLSNLREKCTMTDKEFDARTKSRLEEIAAVEDTIKIINTDEAFANFGKTVSFMQVDAVNSVSADTAERRSRASALLQKVAGSAGAPRLALIAASAQLDTFEKVKAEIDKMVTELKKQQQDEVVHRDWCIKELDANNRSTEAAYDQKDNLDTKKADLTKEIETLTAKIEETKAALAETQKSMKRAGETREAENADFQQTIVDQRLTQTILDKALKRMKEVYALAQEDGPGAPHIQTSGNATDPGNGPARFTKYDQNAGGSRVVAMIEQVIADSVKTEDEAIRSEQDAQAAYEEMMKESNKAVTKYMETQMNSEEAKAGAKASLALTESDLKGNYKELEGLNNVLGDLHKSCDFLIKNFDARQTARAAEIEALGEAKAILSGMK